METFFVLDQRKVEKVQHIIKRQTLQGNTAATIPAWLSGIIEVI